MPDPYLLAQAVVCTVWCVLFIVYFTVAIAHVRSQKVLWHAHQRASTTANRTAFSGGGAVFAAVPKQQPPPPPPQATPAVETPRRIVVGTASPGQGNTPQHGMSPNTSRPPSPNRHVNGGGPVGVSVAVTIPAADATAKAAPAKSPAAVAPALPDSAMMGAAAASRLAVPCASGGAGAGVSGGPEKGVLRGNAQRTNSFGFGAVGASADPFPASPRTNVPATRTFAFGAPDPPARPPIATPFLDTARWHGLCISVLLLPPSVDTEGGLHVLPPTVYWVFSVGAQSLLISVCLRWCFANSKSVYRQLRDTPLSGGGGGGGGVGGGTTARRSSGGGSSAATHDRWRWVATALPAVYCVVELALVLWYLHGTYGRLGFALYRCVQALSLLVIMALLVTLFVAVRRELNRFIARLTNASPSSIVAQSLDTSHLRAALFNLALPTCILCVLFAYFAFAWIRAAALILSEDRATLRDGGPDPRPTGWDWSRAGNWGFYVYTSVIAWYSSPWRGTVVVATTSRAAVLHAVHNQHAAAAVAAAEAEAQAAAAAAQQQQQQQQQQQLRRQQSLEMTVDAQRRQLLSPQSSARRGAGAGDTALMPFSRRASGKPETDPDTRAHDTGNGSGGGGVGANAPANGGAAMVVASPRAANHAVVSPSGVNTFVIFPSSLLPVPLLLDKTGAALMFPSAAPVPSPPAPVRPVR